MLSTAGRRGGSYPFQRKRPPYEADPEGARNHAVFQLAVEGNIATFLRDYEANPVVRQQLGLERQVLDPARGNVQRAPQFAILKLQVSADRHLRPQHPELPFPITHEFRFRTGRCGRGRRSGDRRRNGRSRGCGRCRRRGRRRLRHSSWRRRGSRRRRGGYGRCGRGNRRWRRRRGAEGKERARAHQRSSQHERARQRERQPHCPKTPRKRAGSRRLCEPCRCFQNILLRIGKRLPFRRLRFDRLSANGGGTRTGSCLGPLSRPADFARLWPCGRLSASGRSLAVLQSPRKPFVLSLSKHERQFG